MCSILQEGVECSTGLCFHSFCYREALAIGKRRRTNLKNRDYSAHYKVAALAAMLLATSILHYLTPKDEALLHDIYRRFYYFPVALAGIWFGLWGALAVASAVALLYLPHVAMTWNDMGRELANRLMDVFLIFCLGLVTGYSADVERRLRMRYQQATALVKESYTKLRDQADLLFETEEMLRRADRLTVVGQLTADFAHEIRNPLSSIKGAAEILKADFPVDHPKTEFMDIIVQETVQLNRVVEDYLKLARTEKDGESTEKANLAQLAQETAAMLRTQLRNHTVTIRLNIPESLMVKGHPARIKQVLLNLFLNAVQAVGDGGTVDVSIKKATRKIVSSDSREVDVNVAILNVEDSGPGLTSDVLSKLFQPFFTTKGDGTGLGLAVSRRIMTALGGSLEAENRDEGGARFILSLPLADT